MGKQVRVSQLKYLQWMDVKVDVKVETEKKIYRENESTGVKECILGEGQQ